MERFAKIFETPTTQVLVFLTQGDEGFPKVHRSLCLNGVDIGLHLCWDDETEASWVAARAAFEAETQETAARLVVEATKAFKNPEKHLDSLVKTAIRIKL